jgi:hypothetical protein
MRKLLVLAVTTLTIASCTETPKQKACNAIEKYLKHNLDDPHSYEPGEFDVRTISVPKPGYEHLKDSIDALFKANKLSVRDYSVQDSIIENQYTETTGWDIYHAFRAKNKFGALVGDEWKFHVDTEYRVTEAKPANE